MKKPVPKDFDISSEEFKWVEEHPEPWEFQRIVFIIVVSLLTGLAAYAYWEDFGSASGIGFLTFIVVSIVSGILQDRIVFRYHPLYRKAKLYVEAQRRYLQTQKEHWLSLRGIRFEKELAKLYERLGYSVKQTQVSDDKGIDLILRKDDKKIIVQCKGHKKPVGPSVVRELYGTLKDREHLADNPDSAVLACPMGFTKGAREFALDKPIQLISATDLIEMAEGVGNC